MSPLAWHSSFWTGAAVMPQPFHVPPSPPPSITLAPMLCWKCRQHSRQHRRQHNRQHQKEVLTVQAYITLLSSCRSLRDMMHALDLDGHTVQKPALSTLAESPSRMSPDTNSSGSDGGSVSQGLSLAPRVNSLKRSPLGRSVVTALEAELNQV